MNISTKEDSRDTKNWIYLVKINGIIVEIEIILINIFMLFHWSISFFLFNVIIKYIRWIMMASHKNKNEMLSAINNLLKCPLNVININTTNDIEIKKIWVNAFCE